QWSTPKPVRQALALDQLHDQHRYAAVRFLEAVEDRDARMIQRGEDAGFLFKAGEALGRASPLLGQGLWGDLAVGPRVAGAVDLAHSPGPQPGDDLVGAHARSLDERMDVRLEDVLANQDLRLQKVLHAHIAQVVAERRERGPRTLGVLGRGLDEDVDVESSA